MVQSLDRLQYYRLPLLGLFQVAVLSWSFSSSRLGVSLPENARSPDMRLSLVISRSISGRLLSFFLFAQDLSRQLDHLGCLEIRASRFRSTSILPTGGEPRDTPSKMSPQYPKTCSPSHNTEKGTPYGVICHIPAESAVLCTNSRQVFAGGLWTPLYLINFVFRQGGFGSVAAVDS